MYVEQVAQWENPLTFLEHTTHGLRFLHIRLKVRLLNNGTVRSFVTRFVYHSYKVSFRTNGNRYHVSDMPVFTLSIIGN